MYIRRMHVLSRALMLLLVLLVAICSIIEGVFWYETEEENSSKPKPVPAGKDQMYHVNGGYSKDSLELTEVREHSVLANTIRIFLNTALSLL